MNKFERFFNIKKIDEEERMVFGYASTPDLDSDGEVIKLEALEKALPAYLQFPTLREMHQPKAVGTTKTAEITKGGLYIGAKVVTDEAWKLVKEGVYKAFSIGGNVIKKVNNVIQELELVEVSLVDVPANKHAVIELWKRGKITKNAETVYSLSNLMIGIKDTMMYFEWLGKDTKKLMKALETIKELIAVEATETESEADAKKDEMLMGKKRIIESLERITFENNPNAEKIREGVINNMKKEVKKEEVIEKHDDHPVEPTAPATPEAPAAEVKTETEVKVETDKPAEPAKPVEGEPEKPVVPAETPAVTEGEKGMSEMMQKIKDVEDKLNKMSPAPEEKTEKLELSKAVTAIAGSLAKMASVLEALEGRIVKLEKTPAAVKSKSAVVLKAIGEETVVEKKQVDSKELEGKKARLAELEKIKNSLGNNEFAKQGLSKEAMTLTDEIKSLEA